MIFLRRSTCFGLFAFGAILLSVNIFFISDLSAQSDAIAWSDGITMINVRTGNPVPSGVYLYQIQASVGSQAGSFSEVKKMSLLK